jgi:hypothetical protein
MQLRNAQRPGVAPPAPEYFVPETTSLCLIFAATALMDKRWSAEMSRGCLPECSARETWAASLAAELMNVAHLLLEWRGLRQ